ncbi:MAG TPA: M1 family aminopeptidase [Thermoanaerobaculia bacterium]|jgi:ABC-type transport system involved in multi-copper enzyme maturation permease subunit|nr:M1 family aminopeptidase [Thermoanaerobaculia bacterium]
MSWEILKFELRYHLRQPLFYILFIIFFFMTFGAVTSDAVQIGGALGNVNRNAPFVIMQLLLVMSTFGVLTTTAYVASAINRDFEYNTDSLFFSSPVKKSQYLFGRFTAAFIVSSLVYLGVVTAIMVGSFMPWLDKERLGAFALKPYVFSYFVLILPNLFLFAAIFFTVAALTRSLMATYTSVAAFYVAYIVSRVSLRDLDSEKIGILLDPFGFSPFVRTTRYWTVFEKNNNLLPLDGVFLGNRLLWIGVALVLLGLTFVFFKMEVGSGSGRKKKKSAAKDEVLAPAGIAIPHVSQHFGGTASVRQYFTTIRVETGAILKSLPFIVIMLLAVLNTVGGAVFAGPIFGTRFYPVTYEMLEVIEGNFFFFAVIIAAFYAGEIVWRERMLKLNEVTDTMPSPTWAIWAGKLTALCITLYFTLFAAVLTTIAVQASKDYFHFELGLYFRGAFLILGMKLLLVTILMFLGQIITNNRYVGFLIALFYIVAQVVLDALHYQHHLYQVFVLPDTTYSDMNGYGHFARPFEWFSLYWTFFAAILLIIGHLFWVRGTETAMRIRTRVARGRLGIPAVTMLALFAIAFVSTGCYIFYNTNVLNHYSTDDQRDKRSAETEKLYKRYDRILQPRITDVQANVDIYPDKRWVDIHGTYTLVNKTQQPISDLHVVMVPDVPLSVQIPGATLAKNDADHGYFIYHLAQPLAPGATIPMSFTVTIHHQGFENVSRDNTIVANGTFINNFATFPHLGYSPNVELQETPKRRKYGLAPVVRAAKIDDHKARLDNGITRDADWINLDTTVSTSPDQIALAPGYLQKEWSANGRRYFRYKTTSPILGFFAYLSARYEVKRSTWKGIPIEIYFDPKHAYNVDRMIYGVQKSLDYFTTNFSPYQHKQVRILEFPRYAQFAQSFPNTIPFSESIGFVADLRNKDDIDYVYYVTAHEVAHQWWAHQVIGADVQGGSMLAETLAQYSALMVMEKEYGRDKMRRFLKYELDRYLAGRGGELVAEMPLMLVENQGYIHYRKGSLVMYELRDEIGEDKVNAALRQLIHDHAFEKPPYVTTRALIADFRAVTPPEKQSLITDLFETITLYDNKAATAKVSKRPDGKYVVTVTVESKKFRADDRGKETSIPVNDWVDIGVLGASKIKGNEPVLAIEKHHLTSPYATFSFVIATKPDRAGIDPLNKLVDRNPDDNTKKVDVVERP